MEMKLLHRTARWLAIFGLFAFVVVAFGPIGVSDTPTRIQPAQPAIDFNRQIRPILSENCFACHGPDDKQRKAKLRLDTKDGAFAELRTGNKSIVPGKPDQSELIDRITSEEADRHMPPAKSGKRLTAEQIALLREWIEQGAKWTEHWAFVPPKKPEVPKVANTTWPRNAIDNFILARLEKEGLQPSPEADKTTLIRRVTLDLTGLPPTIEEVDAFLADSSPNAYEKVVDRLFQSSRYGEHMARYWLDAARYADTHGMHFDNYREIWPYRDWVIRAFNMNKRFDRFLIEQLAGDLMPNSTVDQQVATGYLRCIVTTNEGGTIEEEAYVRNVVDCVDTNGTVMLGLGVGCARCHDHKYDPIRMKDYYQLFAFFNSFDGKPLDGNSALPPPIVRVTSTPEQTAMYEQTQKKIAAIKQKITDELARIKKDEIVDEGGKPNQKEVELKRAEYVWIDDELPAGAKSSSDGTPDGRWRFVGKSDHPVLSGNKSVLRTTDGQAQQYFTGATPGLIVGEGDTLFAHVYLNAARPPKEIMLQWNTGEEAGGWKHRAFWGENIIPFGADGSTERVRKGPLPKTGEWVRLEVEAAKVGIKPGMVINGWAFTQFDGTVYWDKGGIVTKTPQGPQTFDAFATWERAVHASSAGLPKAVQEIVKLDPGKRTEQQRKQLRDYFVEHAWAKTRSTFDPLHKQLADAEKELEQRDKLTPASMVFREMKQPKPAFMLKRGEYDQKGDPVGRETPAFLPPMSEKAPRNRLGFAEWLVAPNHPLTARVAVNRFWQQCFGTGIIKTSEDFGIRGELPSHPELLDWLATEFMASNRRAAGGNAAGESGASPDWDIKHVMRLIVTSATYRQSSRITKDGLVKDPANRLLSRGPRLRLDAEMLRDQALFAGGLLVEKIGGPSVKPPQPAGLWEAVGYTTSNTAKFVADTGHQKVHRRSMYTFWKRTSSPPQMTAFDAPTRESCTVRRERTNTPLQALLLMNEPQFVEAARALAERSMRNGGAQPEDRIRYIFRLTTARKPDDAELAELMTTYKELLTNYTRDVDAAKKLIAVGETKPDGKLNPSELAALTMVANLVLNLDEVINKG